MTDRFDPNWYFDNVLADASPGGPGHALRGPAAQWQAWWGRVAAGDSIVQAAAAQGFVLTIAQLAKLGVSRSAQRTAVRRGRWFVPTPGTIAPLTPADADPFLAARRRHALTATATVLRRPDSVVCGRSAAILRGLPTLAVPDRPELTRRAAGRLGRSANAHVFGAALPDAMIGRWFGAPVTTVARAVAEVARHDRREGLVAADAALHERLATTADLGGALDGAVGWPGVRQARSVLALADAASESPLESLTRLALHDAGFPPPRLQLPIAGFRVDFCWPEQRLVLEADGRSKYTDRELWAEKRRERVLRRAGYVVERVVWADVVGRWAATESELWRYFAR